MTGATIHSLDAHRAARGAPEAWVRKRDVANHLGVSIRTVERLQARGMPCRRLSRSLVLYRVGEIDRWLEAAR